MHVCAEKENLLGLKYVETLEENNKVLLKEPECFHLTKDNILEKSYYVTVEKLIGEGSSCKNYEVLYKSQTKSIEEKCILKELYPRECGEIYRVWYDETKICLGIQGKTSAITELLKDEYDRYKKNYEKVMSLGNTPLKDNIVGIISDFFDIVYKNEDIDYIKAYLVTEKDNCKSCMEWIKNEKIELLERLNFFVVLIDVVKKFYDEGYLISDLNLNNLLYKKEDTTLKIKVLDYDSIIKLDEINSKIFLPRTNLYYPTEYNDYNGNEKSDAVTIDCRSSIYSLGIIFLEILFSLKITNDSIPAVESKMHFNYFRNSYMNKVFSQFSNGFKNKVIQILKKSIRNNKIHRYDSFEDMKKDIKDLIEIYENKGVHPEVMLNNAIILAETYKKNDFDECLFTNVKETTEN